MQKPFLKWVGGKTQLLKNIMSNIPHEMENYHEIFLGGGSVLLAVLSLKKEGVIKISGNIYANDINSSLINVYITIRDNPKELLKYVNHHADEYNTIQENNGNRSAKTLAEALVSKESYYYWIRSEYNKMSESPEKSALFMFLNKTCFRGLYREGPNGFNVPFGNYKNKLDIISEQNMYSISELIRPVIFTNYSFEKTLTDVCENDFVYLDPPYAPENSKSFVKYTKDGFGIDLHNKLFDMIKKCKGKFMLSNANVQLVTDAFDKYIITEVDARRAINSKDPGSVTVEVLITNYIIIE